MAPPRRFFTYKREVPAGKQLRFEEGKGYYAGPAKPAGKQRPPITTGNPLMSVISQLQQGIMTPKAMQGAARRDVNAQIAAEQLALNRASQEAREEAYRQAEASEGFSRALMGFAAHDRGAIERAYGAASGSLASLGASLGGQMQGAEQAALAASQADVNRLAPGGVVPTYVPTGEGAANVQGLTGAAATRLGAEGQGYSEGELGAALARGLQGRDLAEGYRYQGVKLNRDRLGKLAELQATRPKLFAEALQGYQGQRNQQLATLLSALSLQTGNVEDVAQLGLAKQKFGLDVQQQIAKQMEAKGLTPSGALLPEYYRDPRTGRVMKLPSGTVIGPKGAPVKLATPKGRKAGSIKQPSLTDWAMTQERMMEGGLERLGIGEDSSGKIELWWSLKNIKDYLRKQYGQPFINTYGQAPQVEGMIDSVANTLFTQLKDRRRGASKAKGGSTSGGVRRLE